MLHKNGTLQFLGVLVILFSGYNARVLSVINDQQNEEQSGGAAPEGQNQEISAQKIRAKDTIQKTLLRKRNQRCPDVSVIYFKNQ